MFDSIFKRSKKEVIAENRRKGAVAEKSYKFRAAIAGYETERTGRGHDFKLYKKDAFSQKRTFVGYREIKSSSTAPLSKLQKKTQKSTPKYKVIREKNSLY